MYFNKFLVYIFLSLCTFLFQLFINQGGSAIDSSNASKIFKTVWAEAMGDDAEVPTLTARGVRYGAVIGMGSADPSDRE